jgi:hypothetical protein
MSRAIGALDQAARTLGQSADGINIWHFVFELGVNETSVSEGLGVEQFRLRVRFAMPIYVVADDGGRSRSVYIAVGRVPR